MNKCGKTNRELNKLVIEAKKRGIAIPIHNTNAGGWLNLMYLVVPCNEWGSTKGEAKVLLRKHLGFDAVPTGPEKKPKKKRATTWENIRYEPPIASVPVKPPVKKKVTQAEFHASNDFLQSYEWRKVRMMALKKYGSRCQCCGATPADGVKMNVDHIKPRRIFPELALDINNLQVLCEVCNHGKGNWDMTDWRKEQECLTQGAQLNQSLHGGRK